jgi:hypothetical protein
MPARAYQHAGPGRQHRQLPHQPRRTLPCCAAEPTNRDGEQPAAVATDAPPAAVDSSSASVSSSATSSMEGGTAKRKARAADSTDPIASFMSRRFG